MSLKPPKADIAYRDGVFEIAGTDRRIALFDLAERARTLAASLVRRAGNCWPARSWTTRCRAPTTCPT